MLLTHKVRSGPPFIKRGNIAYCFSTRMAFVAVLLLAAFAVAGNVEADSGSCSSLKLIEVALNNISSKISDLETKEEQTPAYLGESLTSVTSLLQLSLLREMMTDKKDPEVLADIKKQLNITISKITANEVELQQIKDSVDQHTASIMNQQRSLQSQVTALSAQLTSIQNTLQQLLSKSNMHQETLDDISDIIVNDTNHLPHSCEDILSSSPASPSGYNTIADSNGNIRQVYCHMDKDICDSQGGWTRIAMIDMTDTEQVCPEGFKLYSANGIRACGKSSSGCVSVTFPSDDLTYSQVCGKVLGYQYGSPDAVTGSNINSAYIDGISLTHGNPRYHIWSYISDARESSR